MMYPLKGLTSINGPTIHSEPSDGLLGLGYVLGRILPSLS